MHYSVLTKSRQKIIQEKPLVSLENLFLFDVWLVRVLVMWFRLDRRRDVSLSGVYAVMLCAN